jgi:hypothetical protein
MKPGDQVAGYRIESVLGQGGMGTVYEATQLSLKRTVALKILSSQLGGDEVFRQRFRREGHIQAAIDHPHIVTVYEAGEVEEGLFLAMRLVRGSTLKDMIIGRDLEGARTLRLLKPIADALDTAHEAGLTHRDIKPQNILVGLRDHAFLADFGLTRSATETALTKTGQFVGTIDYISPEQIRGEQAGPASDIYSLTAVLYECLAGVVPYPKPSDAAVLYAHMADPPPRVTDQRPELPPALDEVIARGMAKDPVDRPATASAMIAEAERAFGKRVRAVITPPGPVEGPEEIGLREEESRVPTRESRIRAQPTPPTKPAAPVPPAPPAPAPAPAPAGDDTVVPERPPAPEPDPAALAPTVIAPPRHRPGRSRGLAAGALLGVAVLAAAGFGLGRANRSAPAAATPAALVGSASTPDVAVRLPARWEPAQRPPAIAGLDLAGAMTLLAGSRSDAGLVFGRVERAGAGLLPQALARAAQPAPGLDEPVRTPALQGYRNAGLRVPGYAGVLDVVAAPTSRGTLAFVCFAPAADEELRDACRRVIASARLVGRAAAPVGTNAAYAKKLNAALTRLNREVRTRRRALADARTPQGQVRIAAGLRRVHSQAATSVGAAAPGSLAADANGAIAAALRQTAAAYGRLSTAARAGAGGPYDAARSAVGRAERATRDAIGALERLGYARPSS